MRQTAKTPKELKKQVRGVRPIERALEQRTDAQATVIRQYCLAVSSTLTDDGHPKLPASGLKLHERLTLIAASRRVPVVIDGSISGAAALTAVDLNPLIREYLLAGHASVERGHRLILERLGLSPLLDLQLRLGEGTGAVLAMSIIEAALHAHSEMATFEEAGVSTREEK